jgi:hypothetical protein
MIHTLEAQMSKWTKADVIDFAKQGAIWVAVGIGWGVLSGYSVVVGLVIGLLFFGFVLGSSRLMEWIDRSRR